ncbi:unnamed protein product [Blepharisma stoltei]|uniref:Uncharacterized protein n=1 Tax=Blepharisma stoltei TaxID=1481888 RepID=A0AAU9K6M8_9CILI|nr:unnamed protein product [Blepharisma stoltei]
MFINLNEPQSLRWDMEHSLCLHQQRLKKIQKSNNLSMVIQKSSSPSPKAKAVPYMAIARNRDILRQNQILYERLAEISHKKRVGTQTVSPPHLKSLNYKLKKQNNDKILAENLMLLKRITEKSPFISYKQSVDEYSQIMQLKKMISKEKLFKLKKFAKFEGRIGHLPPLEEDKRQEKSFSHSQKIVNLNDTISLGKKEEKEVIRKDFTFGKEVEISKEIGEMKGDKGESVDLEKEQNVIISQNEPKEELESKEDFKDENIIVENVPLPIHNQINEQIPKEETIQPS